MKAYGTSFSIIRNDYIYEIPFFQRRYVWEEENWKELLESLSNADNCPFLGSIILKESRDGSNNLSWIIIDGQQRLTTLSVLMRACYDELIPLRNTDLFRAEFDDESPWDQKVRVPFSETTYIRNNNIRYTKIAHSRIDHEDYERVVNGAFSDSYEIASTNTTSKIIKCYCFFRKQLKEAGIDTVFVIWNYLTRKTDERDDNGKYLVVIELGGNENEQAIFDTINTAGVRLTCADTIKNALFQQYIYLLQKEGEDAQSARNKAINLYESLWDSMFSVSQESVEYWNKSRQIGRLYRDNIEILLHCVAVIKGFFDPSKDKLSELTQCYKNYISNLDADALEGFIKCINIYAGIYCNNFEGINNGKLYSCSEDQQLCRLMHIMDSLEIATFFPYVLQLLYMENHGAEVQEYYNALEKYLILHAICGESTKNYNKECVQLIKGDATCDSLLEGCIKITSDSFNYGIRHMENNKLATLLLFWVELQRRSTLPFDIKDLHYTYTLEHIMPQKWEQYWSVQTLPVYDERGMQIIDIEEAKRIRTSAVYEIGNMTLLNDKLNKALQNYEFKRKVEGEGQKKGMKDLADCSITKELFNSEMWNEASIKDRTERLSKEIKRLWHISF